jgi:hypothetical protein
LQVASTASCGRGPLQLDRKSAETRSGSVRLRIAPGPPPIRARHARIVAVDCYNTLCYGLVDALVAASEGMC